MAMTFKSWWSSLCDVWNGLHVDAATPPKRQRAKMDRIACPLCSRDVAYSRTSGMTSAHQCRHLVQQVVIGQDTPEDGAA